VGCITRPCKSGLIIAAGEPVELWVDRSDLGAIGRRFEGLDIHPRRGRYGDIWFRDTGPILDRSRSTAVAFRWTGWGGKYLIEGDERVASAIAERAGAALVRVDLACEPGALESNGAGAVITTRECLLNPNRNPGATEAEVERVLAEHLSVSRVIWLERGLAGDHTDGHVDNLARFVAPSRVAVAEPAAGDPNREVHAEIVAAIAAAGLETVAIPSPGAVTNRRGQLMAASHLNFYIANGAVAVPCFGGSSDDLAVARIAGAFPDRRVAGFAARGLLAGGGAAHCITREIPA
jgi:agmatine deiminase